MDAISLKVKITGERLDRYLSQELCFLCRSRIQQLIKQGRVKLNGWICTSKKITVKVGDQIAIEVPSPTAMLLEPQDIPLDILYEDKQLIIINKPANMVVHPAPGHPDGTLVNAVLAHCRHLPGIGGVQRPGIVHRLDKNTTGAIAIAKTELAHQNLQAQLKTKIARREYLGVVHGVPKIQKGTVDIPIGRHPVERKKMSVVPIEKGGRVATTHWHIKERLGKYTLMHFQLETGRTHQIRVHSAYIGCPIVGDPVYGSSRSIGFNLCGQVLHAWKLTLQHPVSGEWIEIIAPEPREFTSFIGILQKRNGKNI